MIHTVNVSRETIAILQDAKPPGTTMLDFEAQILDWWAVRWESATPHERQKMIDSLRITLGDKHAIS